MNENRRVALIAAAILLLLGGGIYFYLHPTLFSATEPQAAVEDASEITMTPVTQPEASNAEPEPEHYPLPTPEPDATPLPKLAESDESFVAALGKWIDPAQITYSLVGKQMIQRTVTSVDNLSRERLSMNNRVIKRVPGNFVVRSRDGSFALSPGNEARYVPLVKLANSAGAVNVAKLYLSYYPLFDKAYRELGYPASRHFNDRLIQVIDHLLATPVVEGEVALEQPKVFYQFVDPALESLSSGQKMMIRMGPVNQAQAKAWLRTFRAQIVGSAAP